MSIVINAVGRRVQQLFTYYKIDRSIDLNQAKAEQFVLSCPLVECVFYLFFHISGVSHNFMRLTKIKSDQFQQSRISGTKWKRILLKQI